MKNGKLVLEDTARTPHSRGKRSKLHAKLLAYVSCMLPLLAYPPDSPLGGAFVLSGSGLPTPNIAFNIFCLYFYRARAYILMHIRDGTLPATGVVGHKTRDAEEDSDKNSLLESISPAISSECSSC